MFDFFIALDGHGLNGFEGFAGIARLRCDPDADRWEPEVKFFDGIAGGHAGIALRVTAHAPAAELCRAFGGAIVSTSANRHGEPPVRTVDEVRAALGHALDAILNAVTGGLERPTPIRDAISGESVRS